MHDREGKSSVGGAENGRRFRPAAAKGLDALLGMERLLALLLGAACGRRLAAVCSGRSAARQAGREWCYFAAGGRAEFAFAFLNGARRLPAIVRSALLLRLGGAGSAALPLPGFEMRGEFSGAPPRQEHYFTLYLDEYPCSFTAELACAFGGEEAAAGITAELPPCKAPLQHGRVFRCSAACGSEPGAARPASFRLSNDMARLTLSAPWPGAGAVYFRIEELSMGRDDGAEASLTVNLGSVEIAWKDLWRLRPGSVLELPAAENLGATLEMAGEALAVADVAWREGALVFTVRSLAVLEAAAAECEDAAAPDRLVRGIIANANR